MLDRQQVADVGSVRGAEGAAPQRRESPWPAAITGPAPEVPRCASQIARMYAAQGTCRYEATISQLRTDIRIAQGDIEGAKVGRGRLMWVPPVGVNCSTIWHCCLREAASKPGPLQPSPASQRPAAHYGGHGFRGPPPGDGPGLTVDVDQLQKDVERSQVGSWAAAVTASQAGQLDCR